jgi:FkbM family methyltransferase
MGALRRVAVWYEKASVAIRLPRKAPPEGTLDVVFGRNGYGVYCIPRKAALRPAARAVIRGRCHEPDTVAFLAREDTGGDIVHAGTFFGDFLPALARSRVDGAQVWAFEPNPESRRCAALTIALNQLTNVVLQEFALGSAAGEKWFVTRDPNGRPLGGRSHLADAQGDVLVKVRCLDDVVPADRRVGLIQLDVEGYEREALAGAARTIAAWRPKLVLEAPPLDWLEEQGYRAIATLHGNTVFAP